ncbi:MAG: methyltransferase domain-containing protein [Firmicutes bacterium]|nr:methyltransferase domain-containing protein [Bacillota bacterium]
MTAEQWDEKLKIHTIGRLDAHADEYHYPYEPTPYCVLERLAESGYIQSEDVVIDYGCGKGRVGFFLAQEVGCRIIGVEYNPEIYAQAIANWEMYRKKAQTEFVCANGESYKITEGNCFYFFNPFSIEIFKGVMGRIMESYYENPRPMQLFFYYPNDEYLSYLMRSRELSFVDEVNCQDLFEGNNERETILIFEIEA